MPRSIRNASCVTRSRPRPRRSSSSRNSPSATANLQDMAQKIKGMADKLDKDTAVLADSDRQRRQRESGGSGPRVPAQAARVPRGSEPAPQRGTGPVLERANRVIRQLAEQRKYDLIVQEAVYVNPRIDITDDVMKALNAGQQVSGGALVRRCARSSKEAPPCRHPRWVSSPPRTARRLWVIPTSPCAAPGAARPGRPRPTYLPVQSAVPGAGAGLQSRVPSSYRRLTSSVFAPMGKPTGRRLVARNPYVCFARHQRSASTVGECGSPHRHSTRARSVAADAVVPASCFIGPNICNQSCAWPRQAVRVLANTFARRRRENRRAIRFHLRELRFRLSSLPWVETRNILLTRSVVVGARTASVCAGPCQPDRGGIRENFARLAVPCWAMTWRSKAPIRPSTAAR